MSLFEYTVKRRSTTGSGFEKWRRRGRTRALVAKTVGPVTTIRGGAVRSHPLRAASASQEARAVWSHRFGSSAARTREPILRIRAAGSPSRPSSPCSHPTDRSPRTTRPPRTRRMPASPSARAIRIRFSAWRSGSPPPVITSAPSTSPRTGSQVPVTPISVVQRKLGPSRSSASSEVATLTTEAGLKGWSAPWEAITRPSSVSACHSRRARSPVAEKLPSDANKLSGRVPWAPATSRIPTRSGAGSLIQRPPARRPGPPRRPPPPRRPWPRSPH